MTMISENWGRLLEPGLRKVFRERLRRREELFKGGALFNTQSSTRSFEEHQAVGELGTKAWNFEDSGRVQYGEPGPTWPATFRHKEFARGVIVERKLMEDNMYPGAPIPRTINQRVEQLADSAALLREKAKAAVFNGAFTDTGDDFLGFPFAGPDSVGLVSTAHPRSPSDSTTQSNEFTLALTHDNLITVKAGMREFTDDQGDLVPIHPDTLLVPPELEETALELVGGDLRSDNAENTINVHKGRYKVVVWDYLTDSNAWFLVDSVLMDEHLVWYERIPLEFASVEDFDTLQAKYRAYMRYSRGWDDWRFIAGSNPS